MQEPALRLATIEAAGQAAVPYTSGILTGIGETRLERIESLLAIRDLHQKYGHIQVCLSYPRAVTQLQAYMQACQERKRHIPPSEV